MWKICFKCIYIIKWGILLIFINIVFELDYVVVFEVWGFILLFFFINVLVVNIIFILYYFILVLLL